MKRIPLTQGMEALVGGTFRSAIKLVPAGERHYLQPEDSVEPPTDAISLYKKST